MSDDLKNAISLLSIILDESIEKDRKIPTKTKIQITDIFHKIDQQLGGGIMDTLVLLDHPTSKGLKDSIYHTKLRMLLWVYALRNQMEDYHLFSAITDREAYRKLISYAYEHRG